MTHDDQSSAPIIDALATKQKERGSTSFSPPGHQNGAGATHDVTKLLGAQAYKADATTQKGIDDRRESKLVRQRAERLAAQAWGADHCFFSTNGSTLSNHVAMTTAASPGDVVLVARNSHKSLIAACIAAHVRPAFLEPDPDTTWDIHHGISSAELERKLDLYPHTKAVFIVSPTYYGVTSDVATLAAICHRRGVALVVDEAWGPHFPFHAEMPVAAVRAGADMSVGSIHKTMAGLEQASLVMMKSALLSAERFELCLDLFETTSPSVPILATIDATRRQFVQDGEKILGEELRLARLARRELAKIEGVRVMGREVLDGRGRFDLDETKVLFDISALGLNGYEAEDWLIDNRKLTLGLSDDVHLLATYMVGSDEKANDALIDGVRALADWARSSGARKMGRPSGMPHRRDVAAELVMSPSDAFFSRAELLPLERAVGRVAAEMISPYPPGIPLILPGERFTETHVRFLGEALRAGAFIMDARDANDAVVRVVA